MARIKQQQNNLNIGKLSVLTLALSGALAAMGSAHAQLTTTQYWTSTDYSVDGTNSINVTAATGLSVAGTVGTLTNTGSVTGSIGLNNQAFRSIAAINNSGLINGTFSSDTYTIYGINNASTINALNNNSGGTISGTDYAINNTNLINTLTNSSSATIIGRTAIYNSQYSTINALVNTGTIVGSSSGIINLATTGNISVGTIGSLLNSGLIEGTQFSGIASSGLIDTLSNTSSGTIVGGSSGITNSGKINTLTNSGTIISSGTSAAGISNVGLIKTLTNSGLISSSIDGISNYASFSNLNGTIIATNVGTITLLSNSSTGTISGVQTGLYNAAYISTLTNSGLISGGAIGINNQYSGGGINGSITATILGSISSLFNSISGTISGGNTAIKNLGSISSLVNSGTISGSNAGIENDTTIVGSSTITGTITSLLNSGLIVGTTSGGLNNAGLISTLNNTITGTISSNSAAINNYNSGTISTLINSGKLIGSSTGVFNAGNISTLTNTGTIAGNGAIRNFDTIGILNNSGLITGTNAIFLGSSSSLGSFTNTGIIAGLIENNSSTGLTITGGSGSAFGTLTGVSAGINASDIGSISSSSGLTITGNQLLNDNVRVGTTASTNFTNAGTLQVNNPVTITGNYAQGSGATLLVSVNSNPANGNITDTGYGRLVVTGDATLDDSTVTVKAGSYALASGQRYVVVAATGTLSVNDVTYSASGYSATGSTITASGYNELLVTIGGTASTTATNSNAASVMGGLFNYSGNNTALLAVYNPALALDSAAANKAGAQLSPAAVSGAVTQAAGAASQAVGNVASAHMDGFRVAQGGGSGVATGERDTDIALWGQFFGGRAAQGERDGVSGYHGNYTGLLLGADTAVRDAVRAGGLFSASKTSVALDGDNTGTSGSVNSYGLTAYASYTSDPWYVNVQAGVARQQYSSTRDISYTGFSGVANGSYNGQQLRTSVEAGYPLSIDTWLPGATLTPIAGLSYSSLRTNGFTETGGSGAALSVNAMTDNSLKSELGAKLENTYVTSYGKLLPSVQLGWRHEYRDDALQTGASFAADSTGSTAFVAKSATPVANLAVLNLGVTLLKSQDLTLSAKYTLETGGGYTAQTGSVQVRYQY